LSWIGLREGRLHKKFDGDASEYIYGRRARGQRELFDAHIWMHKAHVVMLAEQGSIPMGQAVEILGALKEITVGDVELDPRLGDVYTNTERHLIEMIGEVAGAMHTGRSRNDLSASAARMLTRVKLESVIEAALKLQRTLIAKAGAHLETIMPGYTHLQHAQPITFAHWVMAYSDFLAHDIGRLEDTLKRTNLNTLGAAALAGTGHRIDRYRTADLLGFDGILENSLQCVASRDYLLEAIFGLTLMMGTLNRVHEDLFLWTTDEFGMVELDDAFAGTSSIMPQKKNPLLQETVRGRAAHQIGRLTGALAVFKDLPMGHNFDTYEANLLLDDSVTELLQSLHITERVVDTLKVNVKRMEENLGSAYITATELADVMVREAGIPFRAAHQIVGSLVRRAIEEGLKLSEVPLEMINEISREIRGADVELTEESLRDATDPKTNVERRASIGGPAPIEVGRMADDRLRKVGDTEKRRVDRLIRYKKAHQRLEMTIDDLLNCPGAPRKDVK
jgi:argininosuccinate lyase